MWYVLFSGVVGTEANDGLDGHGAQVPSSAVSVANTLFWDCQYRGEWVGYVEVCFLVY